MSVDGMIHSSVKSLSFYSWKIFSPWKDQIRAGITTRTGGCSKDTLSSLNLSHLVNDIPGTLAENRAAVSHALGVPGAPWAVTNQIHKSLIGTVKKNPLEPIDSCDALYLTHKRVIAAIFLADCLPVVIFDPVRNVGVISHAGWRGTAVGIGEYAVKHLVKTGSQIENLIAAAGPGIGPCCYPVEEKVAEIFNNSFNYPENVVIRNNEGGYSLNLEEANMARLRACGLKEDNIGSAGFCTACRHDEFFSYRKQRGLTGRHAALMVLL